MKFVALSLLLAVFGAQEQEKPVPKDSVLIETRGCFKGRVFTATPRPEDEGTTRGPDVTGRNFRVAGPREVMDQVKKYDGQLVQVVGIVRRAALDDQGVGFGVPGGRVTVGGGFGDPTRTSPRSMPASTTPTMDLTSVRYLADRCPLQ